MNTHNVYSYCKCDKQSTANRLSSICMWITLTLWTYPITWLRCQLHTLEVKPLNFLAIFTLNHATLVAFR